MRRRGRSAGGVPLVLIMVNMEMNRFLVGSVVAVVVVVGGGVASIKIGGIIQCQFRGIHNGHVVRP